MGEGKCAYMKPRDINVSKTDKFLCVIILIRHRRFKKPEGKAS